MAGEEDELESQILALRGKRSSFREEWSTAAEAAHRKTVQDRSGIAKTVIAVYAFSVVSVLLYSAYSYPLPSCTDFIGIDPRVPTGAGGESMGTNPSGANPNTTPSKEAPENCGLPVEYWKEMLSGLLNIVTVAVLPVATLVLGFYFGSDKSKSEN